MLATGERGAKPAHSEECRARFNKLWEEDDSEEARAKADAYKMRIGEPPEAAADERLISDAGGGGQEAATAMDTTGGDSSVLDVGKRGVEEGGMHIDDDIAIKRARTAEGVHGTPPQDSEVDQSRSVGGWCGGSDRASVCPKAKQDNRPENSMRYEPSLSETLLATTPQRSQGRRSPKEDPVRRQWLALGKISWATP